MTEPTEGGDGDIKRTSKDLDDVEEAVSEVAYDNLADLDDIDDDEDTIAYDYTEEKALSGNFYESLLKFSLFVLFLKCKNI